jgi:hypothetical protein
MVTDWEWFLKQPKGQWRFQHANARARIFAQSPQKGAVRSGDHGQWGYDTVPHSPLAIRFTTNPFDRGNILWKIAC